MLEVILMIIELMFPTSPAKIDETYPVPVFKLVKKGSSKNNKVPSTRIIGRCDVIVSILTVIWDVRSVLFFKTFSGVFIRWEHISSFKNVRSTTTNLNQILSLVHFDQQSAL